LLVRVRRTTTRIYRTCRCACTSDVRN